MWLCKHFDCYMDISMYSSDSVYMYIVCVGRNTSSTTTLSTGAPQGCVLSPLLFTLLTHDWTAKFSSNHIIKFADDTSVVGLTSNNDETHYREELAQQAEWCGANNLSLNESKTKEVVMDFRRNSGDHPPLTTDSSTVERVSSSKFLGVHIKEYLTWTTNTTSLSLRRHNSAYTFSAGWKEQASLHPSSLLSTGKPLRACWPAASLSGTGTVVQRSARPSSGQWTQLHRSSVPLSPPSWTFSLHDAPVKLPVSWRTPPIPPAPTIRKTVPEHHSEHTPSGCSTAFSPRLWDPWPQIPLPSLKPHTNPLPPETWTITPPSPPPPPPNMPLRHEVCTHV